MSILEKIFLNILINAAKKVLAIDRVELAINQTIDELERDESNAWFELREIERNRSEIFKNISITDENNFIKILNDNGVLPEKASKLYKKTREKFDAFIKEEALKNHAVFFAYAIEEIDKNRKFKDELNIYLEKFANEIKVDIKEIKEQLKGLNEYQMNRYDIQSVLRKNEISEGVFFRIQPAWVDYKQGFIVKRKEVTDIIEKLNNNKIQLVLGAPASGKSVILKNVGYKLAKDNDKIHIIELKKYSIDEIKLVFENILKINNESIFIVDDAHLYLSHCERLVNDFKSSGKGKLIVGSRDTKEIIEEHPREGVEHELLRELSKNAIHIEAQDVTEEIIQTFLEEQYNFDKAKIKRASSILGEYKKDLWFLSWALKSYNKKKGSVVVDEIYDNIAKSIEKIKIGKDKNT